MDVEPGVLGTCRACGDRYVVRADGLMRVHGRCKGARRLPVEGILMPCLGCRRWFLSEDEAHRFCEDKCVGLWEAGAARPQGSDPTQWLDQRRELADFAPYEA